MTLATTESKIGTILAGVTGVGQVHDQIRTETDSDKARDYLLDDDGNLNVWEYEVNVEEHHDGADGVTRTEVIVDIVAHYYISDVDSSRRTFRDVLYAVGRALMNTSTGLVAIKPSGVALVEKPTPVPIRTGHKAYRAKLSLRLWDEVTD